MSIGRNRKENVNYRNYRKTSEFSDGCIFCKFTHTHEQVLHSKKHFFVSKNIFPYSMWDEQNVVDHLMIVPKRHTDTLSSLTADESKEFMEITSEYEKAGYDFYGRASTSTIKSVVHQHTHLIKPGKKHYKIIVLLDRFGLRFLK